MKVSSSIIKISEHGLGISVLHSLGVIRVVPLLRLLSVTLLTIVATYVFSGHSKLDGARRRE